MGGQGSGRRKLSQEEKALQALSKQRVATETKLLKGSLSTFFAPPPNPVVNPVVALLFPTKWWPSGMHYYGLAQAGTDRGLFTYFLNVHALSTKPVLMTFALGASADTAEGMSNAAVWTQVRSPSLLQHTSCASRAWA